MVHLAPHFVKLPGFPTTTPVSMIIAGSIGFRVEGTGVGDAFAN